MELFVNENLKLRFQQLKFWFSKNQMPTSESFFMYIFNLITVWCIKLQ